MKYVVAMTNLRQMCTCTKREMQKVSLQKEMNNKGEVARLEREGSFPMRENWDSSFEMKVEIGRAHV